MGVNLLTFGSQEEWLKNRTRIGGSDAGCILGVCPWKSSADLWDEKMGIKNPKDLSDNPLVEYGHNAEEHLRELFKLDYPQWEVRYLPNNIWINDDYPWAHASLDGWIVCKEKDGIQKAGILEIKTATIKSKEQAQKWRGQIPMNYYAQVLHYLMVTGFDFAVVKAQLKYEMDDDEPFLITRHYIIDRKDVEEDIKILIEKEKAFAESLDKGERPHTVLPEI